MWMQRNLGAAVGQNGGHDLPRRSETALSGTARAYQVEFTALSSSLQVQNLHILYNAPFFRTN
jgi:hypothetical protein